MKLNVLNLVDKNIHQLNELVNATGTTTHRFYSWVHKTRSAARSMVRKITKIEGGNLYNEYSPATKTELRNKREMAMSTFDACEMILTTFGYTPTPHVFLKKDTIEEMFAAACNEEEQASFNEEFGVNT